MITMFRKKTILQYESALDTYPNIIVPVKNVIPDWYKKIPKWKNNVVFDMEKGFGETIKACTPFLDSLTVGYAIILPYDLYVKNNGGTPYVTWRPGGTEIYPDARDTVSSPEVIPNGHYPIEFVWKTAVAINVPIGYSLLVTHPLNRHDLPFTTLTGIVDGGLVMSPQGNLPFFIKNNFEGIIPQGTPIAQLIPFRQENWSSKIINGLVKQGEKHFKMGNMVVSGWYKKTFWTRKKYD